MEASADQLKELISNIDNYESDLRDIFLKNLNDDEILNPELINSVLDEWGMTLGIDISAAKEWLQEGNENGVEEINYQNLTFEKLFRGFQLWLQQNIENVQSENRVEQEQNEGMSNREEGEEPKRKESQYENQYESDRMAGSILAVERDEKAESSRKIIPADKKIGAASGEELEKSQFSADGMKIALQETIHKYEKLLRDCKTEIEKKVITGSIDSLKQQLADLEAKEVANDTSRKNREKFHKKILQALKDIFEYYSKQHCRVGVYTTFDTIKHELDILSLGEFSFIVRDFQLLRRKEDRAKIAETFKKCSASNKDLNFDEFQNALQKLALLYFSSDPTYRNDLEKIDAFYDYMGLYNGTVRPHHGMSAAEIVEELQRRKQLRTSGKQEKLNTSTTSGNISARLHQFRRSDTETSYLGLNHKRILYNLKQPEKTKISISKLEKMNFDDCKDLDETFNPHDLIDENDDEDNVYLAEYNLELEKQLKEHIKNEERKKLEDYGNIKQPSKNLKIQSPVPTMGKSKQILANISASYELSSASPTGLLLQSKQSNYMNRLSPLETDQKLLYSSPLASPRYFDPEPTSRSRGENLKSEILERASQLENQNKRREVELAKKFTLKHANKVNKGVSKYSNHEKYGL